GQALSIAEKLDTLVGLFGIGQPPSGVKDPFALRRAALGVLRITIDNQLALDLETLLTTAFNRLGDIATQPQCVDDVLHYFFDRLRGYAQEQGYQADVFEAVLAVKPTKPVDFINRLAAVADFRQLEQAEALAAANKRIGNILRKNEAEKQDKTIVMDLLAEPAEQALADKVQSVTKAVAPLLAESNYGAVLTQLAAMRETVDAFFDQVMVMAENDAVRKNRLALLNQTRALFLQIADISLLQN
ncbi:UNVERIFIED_CONTAM: hypothetical protein GTU68_007145, partial [Idotea baltica]|nr:hypothetical protein [Idotea baltica]